MKLRDKALNINFTLPTQNQPVPRSPGTPKTAPGEMMAFANDRRSDMLRENEELRVKVAINESIELRLSEAETGLKAWEGAKAARLLDPKIIAPGRFANRINESFSGERFAAFKTEIVSAGGNVQPIKVRDVINPDSDVKYEIIYGHRRHQACLQAGLQVSAIIDNLDDRALFVEMERENRGRLDLSAYEQGKMYALALDSGLYPSIRQLALALDADHGNVSKALSLARLPDQVIAAFSSPLDLQFRWTSALNEAIQSAPEVVLKKARELASITPRPTSKDVFEQLVACTQSEGEGGATSSTRQIVVEGKQVATLQFSAKGSGVLKITKLLPQDQREAFAKLVEDFLTCDGIQ